MNHNKTKLPFGLGQVIITAAFVLLVLHANAQTTPPPKQWDKRFGGSNDDVFTTMQQTTDDGYILGGYSRSEISGDKTCSIKGIIDYWILKTDSNGIKQWDACYGGDKSDELSSLQQTKDGGYILGGSSESGISGDKTEANWDASGYSYDYWVIKIDANGSKQWDKRYGGTDNDLLKSVKQCKDGGYLLAGYSNSGNTGNKTEQSRGLNDFWIVKIDANGNKQWDKRYGGDKTDYLTVVDLTPDGGYILGGSSYSGISGDKTEDNRGYTTDYWIVKVDSIGAKQWDKRFGGASDDNLSCLTSTFEGGYLLGGISISGINGDKTQANRGNGDYWLIKIDSAGKKQWDACYGGKKAEGLCCLLQTKDSGYILSGWSLSDTGFDKSQKSRGYEDYWILKINPDNTKQWDERFGGSKTDVPLAIVQTKDKNFILGGQSYSDKNGDKTQDKWDIYDYDHDYWIVKLGCPPYAEINALGSLDICLSGFVKLVANDGQLFRYQWLKNNSPIRGATSKSYVATVPGNYKVIIYTGTSCKNTSNALTIIKSCGPVSTSQQTTNGSQLSSVNYHLSTLLTPNPTSGNTTLSISHAVGNVQVSVYDMVGKLVTSYSPFKGQGIIKLGVSGLAPGNYLVKVKDDKEETVIKFIKQ